MKKIAYHTGTIELMPYTEHGEFCIVGVFAVDSESRRLVYQILNQRKTKRLTGFFPEMERTIFTQTLKSVHQEWDRLANMVNEGAGTTEFKIMAQVPGSDLFTAITYPREGIIRHKAKGVVLTAEIDKWLQKSFTNMIMRQDLDTILPKEQKLTRDVADYLKRLKFKQAWKEERVGNDIYHANFPFAYIPKDTETVERAIKPLFLGHSTSTKIMNHGDTWLQKVRRLNQFKMAPDVLIFPVQRPVDESSEQFEHADIIINDLINEGVNVVEGMNLDIVRPMLITDDVSDTPLFAREG
jgi:hypothetical protein